MVGIISSSKSDRAARLAVWAASALVVAACSRKNAAPAGTAAGAVDTAVLETGSVSVAAGPAVHVTRTDSKSIDRAMRYELTDDNFGKFMAAADSIYSLEQRDPTAREYLNDNLTDAGSTTPDAGRRWLQSDTVIADKIESAGISVEDYFVQAIAIANAQRFIADPKAAPPTPTLAKNAKFLGARQEELDHLARLRDNKPDVLSTPPR